MDEAASARRPAWLLPVIVVAQLACTSLWFAGNAVLGDIELLLGIPREAEGLIFASVQIGFVIGTLTFAVLAISDRFRASSVFFCCAILGALSNLALVGVAGGLWSVVFARFLTGFFLAGIYPVGMKIAASWCEKGLGRALGYLVGALVVGTALPHLLRGLGAVFPWDRVVMTCSAAAVLGGLTIFVFVPAGPHLPARSAFNLRALPDIFGNRDLRAAAGGYFGHMWELYAFWAYVPFLVRHYAERTGLPDINVSLAAFAVIAAGAIGCMAGGELAGRFGSARVALAQLFVSGAACLSLPAFFLAPPWLFAAFLLVWGIAVAGDSPQFSTLVGSRAPRQNVGTAFTIVNCLGFAITAVSIQCLGALSHHVSPEWMFVALAPGPALGLYAARRLWTSRA